MVSRESRSKWTQLHNGLNSFYHSLMCSFTQMTSIRKCLGRGCRKGDMTLIFPLNAKIPMSFPGTVDYVYIESCFYLPFSKKKKSFHIVKGYDHLGKLCYICSFQTNFALLLASSYMNFQITSVYFGYIKAWVSLRMRMFKSSKMKS